MKKFSFSSYYIVPLILFTALLALFYYDIHIVISCEKFSIENSDVIVRNGVSCENMPEGSLCITEISHFSRTGLGAIMRGDVSCKSFWFGPVQSVYPIPSEL